MSQKLVKECKIGKEWMCPNCDYRAAAKGSLQRHQRLEHGGLLPNTKCKTCDRIYYYESSRKLYCEECSNTAVRHGYGENSKWAKEHSVIKGKIEEVVRNNIDTEWRANGFKPKKFVNQNESHYNEMGVTVLRQIVSNIMETDERFTQVGENFYEVETKGFAEDHITNHE